MRISRLVTRTLRDDPPEAETASHRLMLRAGLIQQVAAGVYAYLPLAWRSLQKIEQIVREEMDAAGSQEAADAGVAAHGIVGADRARRRFWR